MTFGASNPPTIRASRTDTVLLMVAAFLCYTAMYAVRKSFLAGQYLDYEMGSLHFKTVLVISQVMGYMLSKFIGIKVVSEMTRERRTWSLLVLVGFGLLMLLAFWWVPPQFKFIAMFFNGLPLGMVFGIVLSYLEGRQQTELLVAGLSATFVLSTGLVKTTGVWLLQQFEVSEFGMPFLTGLIFFPVFLGALWMLHRAAPPNLADEAQRTKRQPMHAADRKRFLRQHGLGFASLVAIYVLLTIVRDFRDNFVVEFWAELGYADQPALITLTEVPVALVVIAIAALGILIYDNRKAFDYGLYLTLLGLAAILVITVLFQYGVVSPTFWMISTGIGIYLPYILFHCLLFERLLAFLQFIGTIGFLFYVADALGYLGSVVVLLLKEIFSYSVSWVEFFISLNIWSSVAAMVCCAVCFYLFRHGRIVGAEAPTS